MFDTWEIGNFKSLGSAEVGLAPGQITFLTGRNSIGKSSLLQSLLFASQSLDAGRFVTNGALVRLGSPYDVIRRGEKACVVRYSYKTRYSSRDSSSRCEVALTFKPVDQQEATRTRLGVSEASFCDVYSDNVPEFFMHCTDKRMRVEDVDYCRNVLTGMSEYDILRIDRLSNMPSPRTYIVFKGFKAVAVIVKKQEKWIRRAIDEVLDGLIEHGKNKRWSYSERGLIDSLISYAYRYQMKEADLLNSLRKRDPAGYTQDDFEAVKRIAKEMAKIRTQEGYIVRFVSRARRFDDEDIFSFVDLEEIDALVRYLDECNRSVEQGGNRLLYIGPLREDPKAFSDAWQELQRHCPVGKKGELAAVVLEANHDVRISAGMPPTGETKYITIGEAVGAWASYLGVGDEVSYTSFQKLGVGLRVKSKRGTHDLTAVGVGASQVLPVLVGVLSANKNAILLLEQPEIHLHPSAQARLADFLLFARPDLTIVVETHSEAMLTRVRRRVAEGLQRGKRRVEADTSIVFFEEGEQNDSDAVPPVVMRRLAINEYGNLSEWPKGFMDAVQEDSKAIMLLAARNKL